MRLGPQNSSTHHIGQDILAKGQTGKIFELFPKSVFNGIQQTRFLSMQLNSSLRWLTASDCSQTGSLRW